MFTTIKEYSKKHHLIANDSTIIIGLSGGPDSVFLLYFLLYLKDEYNLTLIAAHLDHEWRAHSANDVLFCAQLCQKFGTTFVSAKASELIVHYKKNGSREAHARVLRRSFFEQVRQNHNAASIALAHHEQDQQETFFIRLIRGATLTGLTGMRPKSGYYIRPLLQTSKHDILAYLETHTIEYLTDPTNSSEDYLRNRIRLNVLPALHKADARFDANFLRTIESLQETEDFLQKLTLKTYEQLVTLENSTPLLDIQKLSTLEDFLQKRVILLWLINQKVPFTPTESLLEEIQRFLLQKKSNSHALHTSWMIAKKQNKIFITHGEK